MFQYVEPLLVPNDIDHLFGTIESYVPSFDNSYPQSASMASEMNAQKNDIACAVDGPQLTRDEQ